MDFIICANNFLNQIHNSSLFEKIITNKYELITRNYLSLTKGKIQDYILPPIIKNGSSNNKILYLLDTNIQFLKKITLIFINCIDENIIQFFKKDDVILNVIHIDSSIEIFYEQDNIIHINPDDIHHKNKNLIDAILNCNDIVIMNNNNNE
jgi:hypothetical protein